ncbi:hypothetical protein H4S07_002872 [Coemansia furcata]|uniref:Uncharacterized protein n=1 Tax=Coemansia furcata TaxID=417177 RepID=A0ACC1LJF4_9FUNG|nr:hypothetical protein H4S07_002872 [Coemansia furcata]
MPPVIASSLVKLKLDPVVVDEVWRLFVSEVAPTSARSRLLFSSLQTLKLGFSSRHEYFLNKPVESRTFDVSSSDGDTMFSKIKPRYMRSAQYGRPKFPVLTTLEIHHFPRDVQKFLTLFTASPITSLVICDTPFSVRAALDMTKFRALRSLSFRITGVMDLRQTTNINEALSDVFSTVAPSLQRLTLAMEIDKSLGLQFVTPPFAENLRSLTLEGEYGQRDVVHILQLFPNLYRLDVCITVGEPITTVANLVDEYRRANTAQSLAPLNSSLRIMSAYVQRYFTEPGRSYTRHALAPGLDNYRGLLVGIVCRLPALVTLRVDAKSFDGVNESIHTLVDSSVGPEHLDCLRRLRVQPLGK